MGKTSTLIYLFSNFDESELIFNDFNEYQLTEFNHILKFIEKNTKKIPDGIVKNVVDFAKNYS
ncbi:MAG TPA: hypothetical protein DCG75_07615 [Bacteroidales bacterium]|nr:hypothetical protein [Bacteroidales bacterium]